MAGEKNCRLFKNDRVSQDQDQNRDLCVVTSFSDVLAVPSGKMPKPTAWQSYKSEVERKREQCMALCDLASSLGWGESTTLSNGQRADQKQLYLQALQLDSKNALALNNLGETLNGSEIITLPDGKVMNKRQLYLKAIEVDGLFSRAYSNLGALLGDGEWVTLASGKRMNEWQLYLTAVGFDERNALAYTNLGVMLCPGECVTLPNGERANQRQLHLKAIEADEGCSLAYCNLSKTLGHREAVTLLSGERMDEQQLCLRAMQAERKDMKALGCSLGSLYTRTLCEKKNKTNCRPSSAKHRPRSAHLQPEGLMVSKRPHTAPARAFNSRQVSPWAALEEPVVSKHTLALTMKQ